MSACLAGRNVNRGIFGARGVKYQARRRSKLQQKLIRSKKSTSLLGRVPAILIIIEGQERPGKHRMDTYPHLLPVFLVLVALVRAVEMAWV